MEVKWREKIKLNKSGYGNSPFLVKFIPIFRGRCIPAKKKYIYIKK